MHHRYMYALYDITSWYIGSLGAAKGLEAPATCKCLEYNRYTQVLCHVCTFTLTLNVKMQIL